MAEFVDGRLPVPAPPLFQRPNDLSGPRVDLGPRRRATRLSLIVKSLSPVV